VPGEDGDDTSDLIESQIDTQTPENEENCFQYLKRKFTSVFSARAFDCKKTRLENEVADEQNVDNKTTDVNQILVDEEIQINDSVVEIDTIPGGDQIDNTDAPPITESTAIDISIDDQTTSCTYLDYPFLMDIPSMDSINSSLTMIIMRGLPGSGKSTIVRKLKAVFPEASSCSADDYFLSSGVYQFDRTKLKEAHTFSQAKAEELCQKLTKLVIIDNTNVKRWEMAPYFRTASHHRYTVILVEPRTPWKFNVEELVKKNTHDVDGAVISARVKEWQDVHPQYYGWFLNPADSSLLLNIGQSWLEKCLSNKVFFEDFSRHSNRYNLRSMLHYYSREGLSRASEDRCHCTTRFVKRGDSETHAEEVDRLGMASNLLISALVITPRTLGARVQLTQDQLKVYNQNDNEVEIIDTPQKPRIPGKSRVQVESPTCASLSEAIAACSSSLVVDGVKLDNVQVPGVGRRAHITLGCAEGVRPVQAGLDQLQVLRETPARTVAIPGGLLADFGGGRWMLSLEKGVSVQAVFSGGY